MPKITDSTTIEDGQVMGYVRTYTVGSECTFTICSVEDWEEMTDEEAEVVALDALYGSGAMEWDY